MINQEQVIQLSLEEIRAIDRQMDKLKGQRAIALETLVPMFDCPEHQESKTHSNYEGFKIVKTDKPKYTLDKKAFNKLDDEDKMGLLELGIVQEDVKLSEGNVKKYIDNHTHLMVKCVTLKQETKLEVKEIK